MTKPRPPVSKAVIWREVRDRWQFSSHYTSRYTYARLDDRRLGPFVFFFKRSDPASVLFANDEPVRFSSACNAPLNCMETIEPRSRLTLLVNSVDCEQHQLSLGAVRGNYPFRLGEKSRYTSVCQRFPRIALTRVIYFNKGNILMFPNSNAYLFLIYSIKKRSVRSNKIEFIGKLDLYLMK